MIKTGSAGEKRNNIFLGNTFYTGHHLLTLRKPAEELNLQSAMIALKDWIALKELYIFQINSILALEPDLCVWKGFTR